MDEKAVLEERNQQQPKLDGNSAGKGASFSFGKKQPESAETANLAADALKQTSDSIARDPDSNLMAA